MSGEHQAEMSRIALLETVRNEDNTWEKLAPRYGVTNPDPPWKAPPGFALLCVETPRWN
jgi:hypothetical protein